MSNIAIKVEKLSKAYQLGQIGTGTISRDIERWWLTKIRGKEDPFLKIGEVNDRASKGKSDIIWSLKDINFEINQGDAVGIIGRNGAGKSTLLKLLSRVTSPTIGTIKAKGRIASLLEVGTGFHPELSGRENIYLNGTILGMRKKEIDKKFDEIVDFSGVERYIDTPVKRYSSGMYVRLAFAVAAHLESEILIVDEVLAVGDAEFQKKCLGKMNDVSKGEGRTVLFVSHNLASVKKLCKTAIMLSNGNLDKIGKVTEIVDYYYNSIANLNKILKIDYDIKNLPMQILSVELLTDNKSFFFTDDDLIFEFRVNIINNIEGAYITIDIFDINDELIYWTADYESERFKNNLIGENKLRCVLAKSLLTVGKYKANFGITSIVNGTIHYDNEFYIMFDIAESLNSYLNQFGLNYPGKTAVKSNWITM